MKLDTLEYNSHKEGSMSIRAYKCLDCNREYEAIQRFDSEPDTICSSCNGNVVLQISAPSLKFVGNDWYETTYKGK